MLSSRQSAPSRGVSHEREAVDPDQERAPELGQPVRRRRAAPPMAGKPRRRRGDVPMPLAPKKAHETFFSALGPTYTEALVVMNVA